MPIAPERIIGGGKTLLSIAAATGNYDLFRVVLALPGVDINAIDSDGRTALHHAAYGSSFVSHTSSEIDAYENIVCRMAISASRCTASLGEISALALVSLQNMVA